MKGDITLYDLSTDLQTLHDELMENEGELTDVLEKALDGLNLRLSDKVANIARWTVNLSTTADALDAEIDRLKRRRDARKNLQARLKEYVKLCMEKADKKKIEFDAFTVRIQNNPPSVEILNEQALPARFVKIVQQTVIDKKGIIEALKAGETVGGAELKQGTHLRIA